MALSDDYLVDQLIDMGVISDEEVVEAQTAAEEKGEGVIDTLVTKGIITLENVMQAKAASFGAEIIDLANYTIPDDVIQACPRNVVKNYNVVPVFNTPETITVALSDPSDLDTIDGLFHVLKKDEEDAGTAYAPAYAAENREPLMLQPCWPWGGPRETLARSRAETAAEACRFFVLRAVGRGPRSTHLSARLPHLLPSASAIIPTGTYRPRHSDPTKTVLNTKVKNVVKKQQPKS